MQLQIFGNFEHMEESNAKVSLYNGMCIQLYQIARRKKLTISCLPLSPIQITGRKTRRNDKVFQNKLVFDLNRRSIHIWSLKHSAGHCAYCQIPSVILQQMMRNEKLCLCSFFPPTQFETTSLSKH